MTFSMAPHVTATDTDDGLVLLDEKDGRYWQLNNTGALVLRHLLEDGTVESATTMLSKGLPGPVSQAAADVEQLVSALRRAKLVI
ncbi:lasso peptide biosynthesis PqqD family chaperone [Streptomyces sp. NPDC094034]|uniref:lasso peptide biosynthesis PqqD family chaperone n=1 Tax=Streptomyces sp. NPDC094034 TaxID=3155309 RepID=UPI003333A6DA